MLNTICLNVDDTLSLVVSVLFPESAASDFLDFVH